jgi:hypothetical protein
MGFGTWNLRSVAARKVKSIRGGTQITIPARKRVGFSVGAVLAGRSALEGESENHQHAQDRCERSVSETITTSKRELRGHTPHSPVFSPHNSLSVFSPFHA